VVFWFKPIPSGRFFWSGAVVALCGTLCWAHGVGTDDIRVKPAEFSYGLHPVLQADTVEMEFSLKQPQTRLPDLSKEKSVTQLVSQEFGIKHRLAPVQGVAFSNELKFGFAKNQEIRDGYFDEQLDDQWQQIQRAELTLNDEGKRVQVKLYEQFRQFFKSDRERADQALRYGGQLELRLTGFVSISPEWWMEERVDHQLRSSELERYGTRLTWKTTKTLKILPEAYRERLTQANGSVRQRDGIGIAFQQRFPKQKITVQTKPLFIDDYVDLGHADNQQIKKLDSWIAWTPNSVWSWKTGGVVEHSDRYIRGQDVIKESVYSQLVHRPLEDLRIRVRGDYHFSGTTYEDDPALDRDESRMDISLTPEVQLNDQVMASARYVFELHDREGLEEHRQEQVVTVSLRGEF